MKRFSIILLVLTLVFSTVAYADIDKGDINFVLEKLASTEDQDKRDTSAYILEKYLDREKPNVEGLKEFIGSQKEIKDMIESNGYSKSDVLDSLDIFNNVDQKDIKKVITAIQNSDVKAMRKVVDNYINGDKGIEIEEIVEEEIAPIKLEEPKVSTEVSFGDISEHWAKESITFLAERKIINGYSNEEFAPDKSISNAEFTKLLISLLSIEKKNDEQIDLADITTDKWYYDVVKASVDNKIVHIDNDNLFKPDMPINREQMIFSAVAGLESIANEDITNVIVGDNLGGFNDLLDISSWAKESSSKAVSLGIIKGREGNTLAPKHSLTRAEAATIIRSLYDLIYK